MSRLPIVAALALAAYGCSTSPSAKVPNYGGNWSGSYTITGCNQTGTIAIANICGNIGAAPPYAFTLTQSARNVSGSFTLGTIVFPGTGGTVGQDGSLAIQATSVSSGITIVVNWALNLPAAALTGTISQQWTANGLTGQASIAGTINTAVRSASALAPAPVRSVGNGSIESMIRAIAGR